MAKTTKFRSALKLLLVAVLPVTTAYAQPSAVPVIWGNQLNVTANGNMLAENCNGCGRAGAESQQQLASGDGYVEFVPSTGHDVFSVGIGSGPSNLNIDNLEFALRFTGGGVVEVRENGKYITDARYTPGQRFQIALQGGDVHYYRYEGNTPIRMHTNENPNLQYPMKVEALMLGPKTQIEQVMVWAANAGNTQGNATPQNLSWTNTSNAVANGATLTGSAARAGAQSNETLNGDGFVEFTAVETDKMRAFGLDYQNRDNTFQDIDYAIVLRQAASPAGPVAEIWESGTYVSDTPYTAGTRFRIAVENGIVKYYKYANGQLQQIQGRDTRVQNFPLHADAAFYDPQSTIAEVSGLRATQQR